MLKKLFLLSISCIVFLSYPKNLIITFVYSNPEFIEMQHKTFKKFLQDDYEYIVFSDAPTEKGHEEINTTCAQLGVRCVRIPQNIHEYPYYLPLNTPEIYQNHQAPSNVRHVHCVQYALDNFCFDHEGIVLLIDFDMFLVRPLNITHYMQNYDIASWTKGSDNGYGKTIFYLCPMITFLNMEKLPDKRSLNFNCGLVNECSADSGGFTHYYLKDHPELHIKNIDALYGGQFYCYDRFFPHDTSTTPTQQKINFWKEKKFNEKEIKFLLKNPDTIQFFMDGEDCWFLHYRGGTNYEKLPQSHHNQKKSLINEYLTDIMS